MSLFEKFIHFLATKRNLNTDRHFLTKLKVRNIFFEIGCNGFLTSNGSKFIDCYFDNFLIGNSLTQHLG